MTELLSGVEAASDAELISRVRGGDVAAYGELFARHVEAARRLGRQLVRGPDVDDLVSDAFAKTLAVLQRGGGPDVAFRAYLLTSVRRLHIDKIRAGKKVQPEEDMAVFDGGVPFQDTAVAKFENGAAAKAFSSLPERWQLVLWHLEVEEQKPADIAPLLGMSANSVSALAYRAREGLRQAFLTMHLADSPTDDCRWVNEHLGAYVRKGLSKRDTVKAEGHLDGCRRCTAMYLELDEVNSNLAGIIAPLLLGGAATGYVSSAGGAGLSAVSAFFGRVRDVAGGNGAGAGTGAGTTAVGGGSSAMAGLGAAAASGGLLTVGVAMAASVAAVTTAAFVFGGTDGEVVASADQPAGIVGSLAPSDASSTPAADGSPPAPVPEPAVSAPVPEPAVSAPAPAGDADTGAGPAEPADASSEPVADGAGVDAFGTAGSPGAAPAAPAPARPTIRQSEGPATDPAADDATVEPTPDQTAGNDPAEPAGDDAPADDDAPVEQPVDAPPAPTPAPTPGPTPAPTPGPGPVPNPGASPTGPPAEDGSGNSPDEQTGDPVTEQPSREDTGTDSAGDEPTDEETGDDVTDGADTEEPPEETVAEPPPVHAPAPTPVAPGLTGGVTASPGDGERNEGIITLTFVGIEDGGDVVLELHGEANGKVDLFTGSGDCTVPEPQSTATCTVSEGVTTVSLHAFLPGEGRDTTLTATFGDVVLGPIGLFS